MNYPEVLEIKQAMIILVSVICSFHIGHIENIFIAAANKDHLTKYSIFINFYKIHFEVINIKYICRYMLRQTHRFSRGRIPKI